MKYSLGLLGALGLLTVFVAVPARVHGQQPTTQAQEQHDHDHQGDAKVGGAPEQRPGMMNPDMMKMMADMKARDARLEALVQTMNAAKGTEKTDAIATLLTALVQEHGNMRSSMMNMMTSAEHDKTKQ